MDLILRGYQVNDPTWLYLSFLLILAVYFKFSRFWSVRNLDLALLLAVSPGLLLTGNAEPGVAAFGYVWLFVVSAALLVRTLSDGLIVRRPRLEQNMNAAGMIFLCAATFLFLTTKLLTEDPPASTVESIRKANELIEGDAAAKTTDPQEPQVAQNEPKAVVPAEGTAPAGPGASLVAAISKVVAQRNSRSLTDVDVVTARLIAILAHLAVILGLTLVGRDIFGDFDVGVAMATLYMLLPCTAFDVGKVHHVLPAALVVWAIWSYRWAFVSGALLGLACAMMFFPIFLLPLWGAFYGRQGGLRFGAAVVLTTVGIVSCLLLLTGDSRTLAAQILNYFDWSSLSFASARPGAGFWDGREVAYRIPVFVTYMVMLLALTIWPRRKSLAQVITHAAALVIGTQFWYPEQGGVYVLWYLPLLLLVVFRPHMTNHFAPETTPLRALAFLGGKSRPRQTELAAANTTGQTSA